MGAIESVDEMKRSVERNGVAASPVGDGGIVYTVSPVHTDAYYPRKARELGAFDRPVAEHVRYVAAREGNPLGAIAEYDPFHYEHTVPGGMISNLRSQLRDIGLARRDVVSVAVTRR